MNEKFLIITGGTGGHVIPAKNFANYLLDKNINSSILVDKRGYKYINDYKGIVKVVYSSNLNGSLISKIFGIFLLLIGFIQSFKVIFILKPTTIISFGSYASFFPVLSCIILKPFYRNKLFIHEQNSVMGRTNSFFLNYTNKIFLNFEIKSTINLKIKKNFYIVGSPEKDIIDKKIVNTDKNFIISIFGGSQGSEYITKFSVSIIKKIKKEKKINSKFIIQCPKHMVNKISYELIEFGSDIVITDYFYNIEDILKKTSLVISRAGAGSINDLIKFQIPSILIPLPNAKDNHQFYNALILSNHNVALIIDQNKNELNNATKYIYQIYNNPSKIKLIKENFVKIKVKNSNSLIYKLITNEK